MSDNDTMFVAEIYALYKQIEETIKRYGYEERVLSSNVIAIIEPEEQQTDEGQLHVKSMYTFNLIDKEELEVIKDLMTQLYNQENLDLDDLLGDLGISLN